MEKTAKMPIRLPVEDNELLQKAMDFVNSSVKIRTMWHVINVNAIERIGYTDHGPVHFNIVSNVALRMIRLLAKRGIECGIVKDFGLTQKHAELVVVLGSWFHDFGMTINRKGHEEFSLFLANRIMEDVLTFLPEDEQVIVRSEVLHAIINHRDDGRPLTVEAGIVRVADALDMSKGRSRIPFERGKVDIHSLSAYAIDNVEILEGKDIPIEINIYMTNSAGLFQVDELLKEKLVNSGIDQYCGVKAYVVGETEKKLLSEFVIGK